MRLYLVSLSLSLSLFLFVSEYRESSSTRSFRPRSLFFFFFFFSFLLVGSGWFFFFQPSFFLRFVWSLPGFLPNILRDPITIFTRSPTEFFFFSCRPRIFVVRFVQFYGFFFGAVPSCCCCCHGFTEVCALSGHLVATWCAVAWIALSLLSFFCSFFSFFFSFCCCCCCRCFCFVFRLRGCASGTAVHRPTIGRFTIQLIFLLFKKKRPPIDNELIKKKKRDEPLRGDV